MILAARLSLNILSCSRYQFIIIVIQITIDNIYFGTKSVNANRNNFKIIAFDLKPITLSNNHNIVYKEI